MAEPIRGRPLSNLLGELVDLYGVEWILSVDRLSPKNERDVIIWRMVEPSSPTTAAEITAKLSELRPDKTKATSFRVHANANGATTGNEVSPGDLLGEAEIEIPADKTFFGSIGSVLATGAMVVVGVAAVGAAAAGTAIVLKKKGIIK